MEKLDAINEILGAIGEDPVNALDDGIPDVDIALQALDRITTRGLSRGWWFNREHEYELAPNTSDEIEVPADLITFEPTDPEFSHRIVTRGGKMYDMDRKTFTFGQPLEITAIWDTPWADLPHSFQSYVAVKAARHFQDNRLGSDKHHQYNVQDEQMAFANLMDEHVTRAPANMQRDSLSAMGIAGRHTNPSKYLP